MTRETTITIRVRDSVTKLDISRNLYGSQPQVSDVRNVEVEALNGMRLTLFAIISLREMLFREINSKTMFYRIKDLNSRFDFY
jgi:hypothetical protein